VCWSCIGRAKDAMMDSGDRNMPVLVVAAILALSGLLAIGQGMAFYSAGMDVHLFDRNIGSSEVWGVWGALLGVLVLASAGSSLKRNSSLTPRRRVDPVHSGFGVLRWCNPRRRRARADACLQRPVRIAR
jgi:hypothetical protein